MLGYCRTHEDYVTFVLTELRSLADTRPDQIMEYKSAILKMIILNLDPLMPIIKPLYSETGRPANMQIEIFRSLVLMTHLKIPINNLEEKLSHNPVLRVIAGFTPDNMPGTSSYYDFIDRIVPMNDKPIIKSFKSKPKKKLKKGEKIPPKNPGIVAILAEQVISDEDKFLKRLSRRPERFLQKIFARVAVDSSIDMGLVSNNPSISGDGTCIETGASHYGKKVCRCMNLGIYKCTCDRKFSDPGANWGWDSHKERFFFGYSGYFLSTYNREHKIDLPLYLRLVQANRHDSVSAVFALAEFRELSPNLRFDTFISDSASDNYATYKLLHHWDVNAVIALNSTNKGNATYPTPSAFDKGTPICPSGFKMRHAGYCPGRSRIKWRCPRSVSTRVLKEIAPCEGCSQSPYGRVVYTKPDWDLRIHSRIPRSSDAWKAKMKERTAAERVNDRILIDYGIEKSAVRGKKRISFMVTMAGINIHLDAQVKVLTANGSLSLERLLQLNPAA